jgi:hypothetical protein
MLERANRSLRGNSASSRLGSEGCAMVTNERKIWEAALMLVRRHGAEAPAIAEREARRLRAGGDELTCVVWCWIARSAAELLRPMPKRDECVH